MTKLLFLATADNMNFATYRISQIAGVELRIEERLENKFFFSKKITKFYVVSLIFKSGLEKDIFSGTDIKTASIRRDTVIKYLQEERE